MADEKTTPKADAPKSDAKPEVKSAEATAKAEELKASAHAGRKAEPAPGAKIETAQEPWVEENPRLDNRTGDQQVPDDAWAPKPQHVNGPEVGDKKKLDNRG